VAQHQRKPGHESKLRPQPAFEALSYRPAGKPGAAIRATSPAVLTLLGGETTAG
jgi:hypothetical protein